MYISLPAKVEHDGKKCRLYAKALNMTGEGKDAFDAQLDLERQLQLYLELPIELDMEPIKDDRVLLISNYGEKVVNIVWELSPEILTGGQERKKRVEEGHLKSSR